jgi:hypothetical protein
MKPPPDTREQMLLHRIFDNASSGEECKKAIELLKKETGKDRSGLVEKYTDDTDDLDAETYRCFWELEKNRRIQAEVERDVAKIDLRDAQKHLRKFEDLTRQLASKALDAGWLSSDHEKFREIRPSTETETDRLTGALQLMVWITVPFAIAMAKAGIRQAPTRPVTEAPKPAAASVEPSRTWTNYETPAPHTLKIAGNGKNHKAPYPVKPIEEACAAYQLVLTPTQSPPDLPPDYPVWRGGRRGDAATLFTTTCPVCSGVMHVSATLQRWTCQCDRSFHNRKYYAPDVIRLVEHLTGCSHLQALWWVIGTGSQPLRKEQPQSPPPPKAKRRKAKRKTAAESPIPDTPGNDEKSAPVSTARTFGDFSRSYREQRAQDREEGRS